MGAVCDEREMGAVCDEREMGAVCDEVNGSSMWGGGVKYISVRVRKDEKLRKAEWNVLRKE